MEKPNRVFLEEVHRLVVGEDQNLSQAIVLALDLVEKDQEWLDKIKHRKIDYAEDIADNYRGSKWYKELVTDGRLRFKDLKEAHTTREYLRQLESAQSLRNTFRDLRAKIKERKAELAALKRALPVKMRGDMWWKKIQD